jgi:hypothetical protein
MRDRNHGWSGSVIIICVVLLIKLQQKSTLQVHSFHVKLAVCEEHMGVDICSMGKLITSEVHSFQSRISLGKLRM